MTRTSGPQAGREAHARLLGLIDQRAARGESLPTARGGLHLAEICRLVGIGRAAIYQNPAIKATLEEYAALHGLRFSSTSARQPAAPSGQGEGVPSPDADPRQAKTIRDLERRVASLEKRNATLAAENAALRAQVQRRYLIEDEMIPTGRRFLAE